MKDRVLAFVLGATGFWGPAVLAASITKSEPGILLGSILSFGGFLVAYLLLRRSSLPRSALQWMFWGIVFLGGYFSMIAFTAMGAGLSGMSGQESLLMLLICLIPGWIALYGLLGLGNAPALILAFALVYCRRWV